MVFIQKSNNRDVLTDCLQHNVSGTFRHAVGIAEQANRPGLVANSNLCSAMEGQPQTSTETVSRTLIHKEDLHRKPTSSYNEGDLCARNSEKNNRKNRSILEHCSLGTSEQIKVVKPGPCNDEISVRGNHIVPRKGVNGSQFDATLLQLQGSKNNSSLAWANSLAGKSQQNEIIIKSDLVIASFNCQGWKTPIIEKIL